MGHNLPLGTRRWNARGLNPRLQRAWRGRRFVSLGIGGRASKTFGTGNSSYVVYSRKPGTAGNSTTFRVAVVGNNTPASVTTTGDFATGNAAVVFNSATGGAGAAQSTVKDMIQLVNSDFAARQQVHIQPAPASDATGVVAAVGATALTGGTAPG